MEEHEFDGEKENGVKEKQQGMQEWGDTERQTSITGSKNSADELRLNLS